MKRPRLRILVFAIFLLSAVTLMVLLARPAGVTADNIAEETHEENGYVLKAEDGKIALFKDSLPISPAVWTDIDVATLRDHDRKLLESGIRADSYEDVLRLIEDFGP